MKTCFSIIIFCILFSISPRSAFAANSVVINEFFVDSGQWVELYNSGEDTIPIGGWYIDDDGGSEKYTIPQGTMLSGGEFKVFGSGDFNFDKSSADEIKLLNGDLVVDSYSYGNGPGAGNSYGRNTDGSGQFVAFSIPTRESSNNASSPLPAVTPKPEKQPTPTRTPTPIKTPTPKKAPTPTKAVSNTTKTSIADSSDDEESAVTSGIKVSNTKTGNERVLKISGVPTSILGISSKSATPQPKAKVSEKPIGNVMVKGSAAPPYLMIAAGTVFCAACGILVFLQKRRKKQE